MLGEAVESCQACRPWATRPTLPSAKSARFHSDGAASRVLQRCAGENSPSGLSVAGVPCTTPNGAPTYVTVFMSSSTKSDRIQRLSPNSNFRQFPFFDPHLPTVLKYITYSEWI